MANSVLDHLVAQHGACMLDGACGSALMQFGLPPGDAPEIWGDTNPAAIERMHDGYLEVGAHITLANTFGANAFRLEMHQRAEDAFALSKRMAEIARGCVDRATRRDGVARLVAGSVGPLGSMIEPHGPVTHAEAVAAFVEQMRGLVAGGADIAWIETMYALEEADAAAEAAALVGLPASVTFSFDTNGRTMMGVTAQDVYRWWRETAHRPLAIGGNCGRDLYETLSALSDISTAMRAADAPDTDNSGAAPYIVAKANAGIPVFADGKVQYVIEDEHMSEYANCAIGLGVKFVGGCCGTDPMRLAAIGRGLQTANRASGEGLVSLQDIRRRNEEAQGTAGADLSEADAVRRTRKRRRA